jgi:hypothetical protein
LNGVDCLWEAWHHQGQWTPLPLGSCSHIWAILSCHSQRQNQHSQVETLRSPYGFGIRRCYQLVIGCACPFIECFIGSIFVPIMTWLVYLLTIYVRACILNPLMCPLQVLINKMFPLDQYVCPLTLVYMGLGLGPQAVSMPLYVN